MFKKILVVVSLLFIATPSYAVYEEVECNTDPVFAANSCWATDQCFNGWTKMQWDNLGLLSDLWMNVTDVAKILYKEEQSDPEMINLDSTNVSWTQTPNAENFWEYTDEFNELYSELEEGYVLDSGKSVNWIKSTLSSAYKLDKNTATEGSNIGLLVYPISTHNILSDGEITIDNSEHRECVLFKSGEAATEITPVEEEPKKLPETGPAEFMLLAILAMILSFGFLQFRARS